MSGTALYLLLFGIILGLIFGVVFALLAGILSFFAVFALLIAMLLVFPVLMYFLTAIYTIQIREDLSFFESYSRLRLLLKGNYWVVWVLSIVVLLMLVGMGIVIAIPQMIATMIFTLGMGSDMLTPGGSPILHVFEFLTGILQIFVSAVPVVMFSFQYFSLRESKEGLGIMSKIDQIGESEAPNNDEDIVI